MADTGPLGSRGEERTPSTSNRVISLLGGGGGAGNLIFNAGLLAAASSALFPPSERLPLAERARARSAATADDEEWPGEAEEDYSPESPPP